MYTQCMCRQYSVSLRHSPCSTAYPSGSMAYAAFTASARALWCCRHPSREISISARSVSEPLSLCTVPRVIVCSTLPRSWGWQVNQVYVRPAKESDREGGEGRSYRGGSYCGVHGGRGCRCAGA